VAAQRVQRSGFPEAYAAHEPAARALASALTGQSPRAFTCRVADVGSGRPAVVRDEISSVFAGLVATPVVTGRAVTVGAAPRTTGWALAHYLVAQAQRLGIRRVAYAGRVWTAGARSGDGWVASSGTLQRQVRVDVAAAER
jgi:hypothetical protein